MTSMTKNKVNPTVALKKYLTNKNVEWCNINQNLHHI